MTLLTLMFNSQYTRRAPRASSRISRIGPYDLDAKADDFWSAQAVIRQIIPELPRPSIVWKIDLLQSGGRELRASELDKGESLKKPLRGEARSRRQLRTETRKVQELPAAVAAFRDLAFLKTGAGDVVRGFVEIPADSDDVTGGNVK